uniref:Reverse transcriptase domain-containing protein n=1 Tax=Strongyloides papillosus TaxID=174720 RepID=A0A0N5C5J0_STREA
LVVVEVVVVVDGEVVVVVVDFGTILRDSDSTLGYYRGI